jgi:hypothetical protein
MKRHTRKKPKKSQKGRVPRNKQQVSTSTRQVRAALDAYAKAQRDLEARGRDVLAVADHVSQSAVDAFRSKLQAGLIEACLLDDLSALEQAIQGPSELPEHMAAFRLLPSALLQWAEQNLGLLRHLEIGEELELPAADLRDFDATGAVPVDPKKLVRVKVVRPGWNHGRQVLVPPRVEVCEQA